MLENKLNQNSKYFNLEKITLKQKKIFNLLAKNNLDSIVKKIITSVLDNSHKFIYRSSFESLIVKCYMFLFK